MNILQGDIGSQITLADFENKDSILINTMGGNLFEGFSIYDYVKNNNVDVGVVGICASAGILPLLGSPTRWGTPNSRYLIHLPSNRLEGNAVNFEEMAKALREEETQILDVYEPHLTIPRDEILSLMKEERILLPDEALRIGLITEIKEIENKVEIKESKDVLNIYNQCKTQLCNNKNEEVMTDEERKAEFKKTEESLFKRITNFFSPKNIMIQDVNGAELDFGEAVETADQIAVDAVATVAGEPAQGDYTLDDGTVYTFEAGVLETITDPVPVNEEAEALKTENEELKTENTAQKEEITNLKSEKDAIQAKFNDMESIKNDFEAFKNKFSGDPAPVVNTAGGATPKKKTFDWNNKNKK